MPGERRTVGSVAEAGARRHPVHRPARLVLDGELGGDVLGQETEVEPGQMRTVRGGPAFGAMGIGMG